MPIPATSLQPKFIKLFRETFAFTSEEFDLFTGCFNEKRICKKTFYVKPGMVCDFKAYINKGCMRTYTVDPEGHERVVQLAFEDWWVSDIDSYYSGQLSAIYVQALEDCDLLEISKADFQMLEKKIPKLNQWYTLKLARRAAQSMKTMGDIKTLSLQENYLKLLETNPEIFQRVPLQYIASYLNVEPQSLSRMRKRLTKEI